MSAMDTHRCIIGILNVHWNAYTIMLQDGTVADQQNGMRFHSLVDRKLGCEVSVSFNHEINFRIY